MNDNRGKILIVENEASSVATLTNILSENYDLHVETNGQEALKNIKNIMPNIIVLDIDLSGKMDGYEVIKQLKNADETKEIPVIFTIEYSSIDDKGVQLGAADYIIKPYEPVTTKLRIDIQMQIVNQRKLNEEQTRLAFQDHLTGLYNKRFFDMQMDIEWKRAIREKTINSLLMIDIDNFKKYNDQYGHPQGDKALKAIADALKNTLRPSDYVSRWGGEEFAVLLSNTDFNSSLNAAERIRETVEATIILAKSLETKITISIGVCTHAPTSKCLIQEFIKNADDALYRAKKNGRNRVEFHDQRC